MRRVLAHLFAADARARFPAAGMERIAAAIAEGETRHRAEVCFAVEGALPLRELLRGTPARVRAQDAFARLRVWDTADNTGVLLYLLLADHRIEIVADRGLSGRIGAEQWQGVCRLMEERLRAGEPVQAVLAGIAATNGLLAEHVPRAPGSEDADELCNVPVIL